MYEIFDIHGHFLPGMDDGCKTPEESVKALTESAQQGVTAMFATPHYYSTEPVEDFLKRRQKCYDVLQRQIRKIGAKTPEIILGAEVACRPGLSNDPNLRKLCMGSSNYMLLELPWSGWSSEIEREILNISCVCGITPILAHLERYTSVASWDQIKRLLKMDVLVQVNGENILSFRGRRAIAPLKRQQRIDFLGSDCHNTTTRPANMGQVCRYMDAHHMEQLRHHTMQMARQLFEEAAPKA